MNEKVLTPMVMVFGWGGMLRQAQHSASPRWGRLIGVTVCPFAQHPCRAPKGEGSESVSFLFDGLVDFPSQFFILGGCWLLPRGGGGGGVLMLCYNVRKEQVISMALKISNKGSVTIPAELRKRYKLRAGSKVVIVDYGGMLVIVPAVDDPIKKGYGFLKGKSSMADDLKQDRELEKQRDVRLANG